MSAQYDLYLQRHKANVQKALEWFQEYLPDLVTDDISWQVSFNHDASKLEEDEYNAYDAYFYGGNRSYEVVQDFKKAFLLHIHRNPHHWQHWILIHDDPNEGEEILDMPYNYILEMVCDWWSFSWEKGNLFEIFDWYEEHKDYIKLSDNTRKMLEKILDQMKEKMMEGYSDAELVHYGVKGQKWGVTNGPPYPIDRASRRDTIIRDAIESGEISKKINPEKQMRHTKEGHLPGRSYIDGDLEYAQKLVDELSGTGEAVCIKGNEWLHKEKVTASHTIGFYIDPDSGIETKTNKAMIVYSKTGSHIYPRRENEDET